MLSTSRMTQRTAVSSKQDGSCVRHVFLVACPDDVGRRMSCFDLFVLNVRVDLLLCNSGWRPSHQTVSMQGDEHVQSRHRKNNEVGDEINSVLADAFNSTLLICAGYGAVHSLLMTLKIGLRWECMWFVVCSTSRVGSACTIR